MSLKSFANGIAAVCFLAVVVSGCGDRQKDGPSKSQDAPVLGTRCHVAPSLTHLDLGYELCRMPRSTYPGLGAGDFFFAFPVSPANARKTAVKLCEDANALDEGYLAGEGKSCWEECEKVVACLAGTPAP